MSRRPVVLLVVAVLLGAGLGAPVGAAPLAGSAHAAAAGVATATLVTPVLSARRVPGILAGHRADVQLQSALEPILAQVTPTTCVVAKTGGRPIEEHNADLPVRPASTEKLLTATAVLDRIGPDTKLKTRAVAASAPSGGVVHGDLFVIGAGDPLLTTSGYTSTFEEPDQAHNDLAALADAIKNAGVTSVEGSVVGDESRYDTNRYLASWPGRYIRSGEVGPVGALMVNDGFSGLSEHPDVPNRDRKPGEPAALAAETMVSLLRARGVAVSGPPHAGQAPGDATEVASLDSLPMSGIIGEMLRQSDNTTAEMLIKELAAHDGGQGTTARGAQVVHETLDHLGLPTTGEVTADGSGLDLSNRVTCGLLVAALDHQGPTSALAGSLPVAGRTGTLRKRLRRTAAEGIVRAKTGTLNEVSALAGFAHTASGQDVTFAIVINGILPSAVDLTDQLTLAIAQYGAGLSLDQLGPTPPP